MTDTPKRRWYQYSLRTLFVFMVLCAIACSWFAVKMQRVSEREETVRAIRKEGGWVWYDYKRNAAPGSTPEPPGPLWMRKLLGDNFFAKVVVARAPLGVRLEHWKGLTDLEVIDLKRPVTDADLEYLKELTKLKELPPNFQQFPPSKSTKHLRDSLNLV